MSIWLVGRRGILSEFLEHNMYLLKCVSTPVHLGTGFRQGFMEWTVPYWIISKHKNKHLRECSFENFRGILWFFRNDAVSFVKLLADLWKRTYILSFEQKLIHLPSVYWLTHSLTHSLTHPSVRMMLLTLKRLGLWPNERGWGGGLFSPFISACIEVRRLIFQGVNVLL